MKNILFSLIHEIRGTIKDADIKSLVVILVEFLVFLIKEDKLWVKNQISHQNLKHQTKNLTPRAFCFLHC
jgi:hypothetical protein